MTTHSSFSQKVGYTRKEFGAIFQIYSQNVYYGLFKDFSFVESKGRYYISFREEAGKTPLITIEKQRLGPDRVLFIATSPGPKNTLIEIARSEKIDPFIRQLRGKIEILRNGRGNSSSGSTQTIRS
ncbi:MAG: hypothetical protein AAF549_03870 [Pseudomonadota bacterium]